MPFLHGFRRIIYEYQPLVDAVLCVVGIEETGDAREDRDEAALCTSLSQLLDRESHSEVFPEGISYALFRVAERGLVCAARTLLRYGADLNFEDPVSYYNPLHIAVMKNRPNMVRLLVEHGADVEKRGRIHESSPLDLASEESERLPCLLALLDLGADVNARDRHGKTPLLHALACSDGLTVHNTENIQLLLQRGADMNAATADGETAASSLVFLVREALEASEEDAAAIGRFCLRTTRLLLAHGMEPSGRCPCPCCCLEEDEDNKEEEPSLTHTSLEHFDLFFPLAVLLVQSGAAVPVCPFHRTGASSSQPSWWSGCGLIFQRLHTALKLCNDPRGPAATELLEQAETLLDMVRVDTPALALCPGPAPLPQAHSQALVDLHRRLAEHESGPPALKSLCRAFIRGRLRPWPLDERVRALPLPDRLKDFLAPERTYKPRPGWDRFRPKHT